MGIDRKALRNWLTEINGVLKRDWDPVGVFELGGPKDEYESYAGSIVTIASPQ